MMNSKEKTPEELRSRLNAFRSRALVASISMALIFWGSLAVIIFLLLTK